MIICNECIDMAETILLGFPDLLRAAEILRKQETAPERSVSRQGHLVQAGRTAIDGLLQLLHQIGPRDVRYFLIMGPEMFPDQGHLLFLPEERGRRPGASVAKADADLPNAHLID